MDRYSSTSRGAAKFRSTGVSFTAKGQVRSVRSHGAHANVSGGTACVPLQGNSKSAAVCRFPAPQGARQTHESAEGCLHGVKGLLQTSVRVSGHPSNQHVNSMAATAAKRSQSRNLSHLRRSLCASSSRGHQQAAASSNSLSRRAKTPAPRRFVTPQPQSFPHQLHGKPSRVHEGRPHLGDHTDNQRSQNAVPSEMADAMRLSDFPHLQQRRTWLLLQHLMDELEQKAQVAEPQSDVILQQPGTPQQLLQPFMALLPLKQTLHQLIEQGENTNPPSCSVDAKPAPRQEDKDCREGCPPRPSQVAQRTSVKYRSKSVRMVNGLSAWPAGGPSRPSQNRLSDLQHSAPSPTRCRSTFAGRAVRNVSPVRGDNLHLGIKGNGSHAPGRMAVSLNASRLAAGGGRSKERISPARGRVPPSYAFGSSAGPGEMAELKWYEKPCTTRAVSTGMNLRPKYQVASRLPPGALEHKRSLKQLSGTTGSLDKAELRTQLPPVKASSKEDVNYTDAVATGQPSSSPRSDDSGDTLKPGNSLSFGLMSSDGEDSGAPRTVPVLYGSTGWGANGGCSDPRFTFVRTLGAQPPSPSEDRPDEEEIVISCHSETSTPRGLAQRLMEAAQVPPARHADSVSSQHLTDGGDGHLGIQQHSQEELFVSPRRRRDRHLSISDTAKRRAASASSKFGRLVHPGADSEGETLPGLVSPRMHRIKETPRTKELKKAHPHTSGKAKPEKSAHGVHGKAAGAKDAKTSSKLPRVSSRELVPPGPASARRVSAPPQRKSTQQKVPPALSQRHRPSVTSSNAVTPNPNAATPNAVTPNEDAPPASISIPVKTSAGRRKSKLPAKPKASNADTPKDTESPQETPRSLEEEKKTSEESPEHKESPEPEPFPCIRMVDLPALEVPIRPTIDLEAFAFKADPVDAPDLDDSALFSHVLERPWLQMQKPMEKTTEHTTSCLSNDSLGTMLLFARWMDTAMDTVESNSVIIQRELPWRHVIPPLFIGINTHRELLKFKLKRCPPKLKEVQDFLRSEGFIPTEEQKLKNLLGAKGPHSQRSEELEKPKTPTPHEIYLNYVLAVATACLRLRQQPVVLKKISPTAIWASSERSIHSCCSDTSLLSHAGRDSTACSDSSCCAYGDGQESFLQSFFRPLHSTEGVCTDRRFWSCLPVRSAWKYQSKNSSFLSPGDTRSRGFPCSCFGGPSGLCEHDIFDSMAAQQIQATVSRIPVLPSETYLRYLRLSGRRKELEALVFWLAGRSDIVPRYEDYMGLNKKSEEAAAPKNGLIEEEEPTSSSSPSSGASRTSSDSNSHSSNNSKKHSKKDSRKARHDEGSSLGTVEEVSETQPQDRCKIEGHSPGSSLVVSLYSSPCSHAGDGPAGTPSSPHLSSCSGYESPLTITDEHEPVGITLDIPKYVTEYINDEDGGNVDATSVAYTESQGSQEISLSQSPQTPSWKQPSGLSQPKNTSDTEQAQLQRQRRASTVKAKPKKPLAKSPTSLATPTRDKTASGERRSTTLVPAQRHAQKGHGSSGRSREHQRSSRSRHGKATGSSGNAKRKRSETAAVPVVPPPEKPATNVPNAISPEKTGQDNEKMSAGSVKSASPLNASGLSPHQTASSMQKNGGRLKALHKRLPERFPSPKRFYVPQRVARYPGAALQPQKKVATGRMGRNYGTGGIHERLTREAMKLLTEREVLAEVASLCARLSAFNCCTEAVAPPESEQAVVFPKDIDEPSEATGTSRLEEVVETQSGT